jgi:hypothetical protein
MVCPAQSKDILPYELLDRAQEFLWTYHNAPPTKPPYWPRYFLLCHAVELVLKAYIALRRDLTQAELRDTFRHDLEKLLKEATRLGLTIKSSVREVEKLNEAHKKYWARYANEDAEPTFVIEQFEQSVEELFKAVRLELIGL